MTNLDESHLSPSVQSQILTMSACPCCGLLQSLPPPMRGSRRLCCRCNTPLGSGIVLPEIAFAFALTSLFVFWLTQHYPLLGVEIGGLQHSGRIISGVDALVDHGFSLLAFFVLAVAVLAPLLQILIYVYVLGSLHFNHRSHDLIPLFKIAERLRPWAMLDVFMLGAIVASAKLKDLAEIDIGAGFWALGVIVLILALLDLSFDRRALWNLLAPPLSVSSSLQNPHTWISCHTCELLQETRGLQTHADRKCIRCGSLLHHRKPESLKRTWALVIAGFLLYIPANAFAVLTVTSFGKTSPSTIMDGVRTLMNSKDWPFAIIVFVASIAFPLLKLLGLSFLMITIHRKSHWHLVRRTRLYRIINFVGRWSVIDVFVAALLTAVVALGNIADVMPGYGIVAFCAVVILTMLATETFDPRLMWDVAEIQNEQ